jgi:hypothetical protein
MINSSPITPPPELMQDWWEEACRDKGSTKGIVNDIAIKAAQWGADQRGAATEAELQEARDKELDACCLELVDGIGRLHVEFPSCLAEDIRAARRPTPKPPETIEVDGFTYRLVQ